MGWITLAALDWTALATTIAALVVTSLLAVIGWFLRHFHTSTNRKLDAINTTLTPLPVMARDLEQVRETVGKHSDVLPDLEKAMALVTQRIEMHSDTFDTHHKEIDRLRERAHRIANEIQLLQLQQQLPAAERVPHKPHP